MKRVTMLEFGDVLRDNLGIPDTAYNYEEKGYGFTTDEYVHNGEVIAKAKRTFDGGGAYWVKEELIG